jgi:DICT domain-containing protein
MQPESTLNQLRSALPDGQLPSSFGVYFKTTLVALCHALEDHILKVASTDPADQPLVIATFQQGKWYLQEADRYRELASYSKEIAIAALADSGFNQHPTGQLDNVAFVDLAPDDRLVEEWNLVIFAPSYAAMVLCHELSPDEYLCETQPQVDAERKFYGLWTFDRQPVAAATQILIDRMRPYDPELCDRLQENYRAISQNLSDFPADLTGVVSRIVTYLQTSQQQLITVSRQTRELSELEGQALRLNRNLAGSKLQAFLRMAQRVDERDADNPCASLQVSALAETLGQLLDLPTISLRRLRLAGLLYRIGLAEAPSEVFVRPPEELDAVSLAVWNDRSMLGSQLLSTMGELAPVKEIVQQHLEHWDGSGKPKGLKGEEIQLEARILGLAAYFQDLTQPRGDRPALSLNDALQRCQALSGKAFDPVLVESLSTLIRLAEIGLMQLPDRPRQLPAVWLEEATR